MPKEALIKLRCSQDLKDRLTALAKARDQSVADYVRTRLLDTTPELRAAVVADPQAPYGPADAEKGSKAAAKKLLQGRTRRPRPR